MPRFSSSVPLIRIALSHLVLFPIVFFLGLGLPTSANAQVEDLDVRFGVKTGISASSLSGNYIEVTGLAAVETRARLGLELGGYMIVDFGQPILVQPELTYVQKGHRVDISALGGSATLKLNSSYLEIPILARFEIPFDEQETSVLPYVVGGPAFAISLNASSEAEGQGGRIEDLGFKDDLSSTDIGLAAGGGVNYDLNVGTVAVELRYVLGLSNVVASTTTSARNRSLRLTVGLLF